MGQIEGVHTKLHGIFFSEGEGSSVTGWKARRGRSSGTIPRDRDASRSSAMWI